MTHIELFLKRLLGPALDTTTKNKRVHQAAGIYNFGDDTGCSSSAPTLKDVFGEIAAWLNLEENEKELLYIKMETFVGSNVSCSGVVSAVAGFGSSYGCDRFQWDCIGFFLFKAWMD